MLHSVKSSAEDTYDSIHGSPKLRWYVAKCVALLCFISQVSWCSKGRTGSHVSFLVKATSIAIYNLALMELAYVCCTTRRHFQPPVVRAPISSTFWSGMSNSQWLHDLKSFCPRGYNSGTMVDCPREYNSGTMVDCP